VEDGPKIEDDFRQLRGSKSTKNHPARDMQDTFFCRDGKLP